MVLFLTGAQARATHENSRGEGSSRIMGLYTERCPFLISLPCPCPCVWLLPFALILAQKSSRQRITKVPSITKKRETKFCCISSCVSAACPSKPSQGEEERRRSDGESSRADDKEYGRQTSPRGVIHLWRWGKCLLSRIYESRE
jgi:hypothetical protein